MRSFKLPVGVKYSILPKIWGFTPLVTLLSLTSGVRPMASNMLPATFLLASHLMLTFLPPKISFYSLLPDTLRETRFFSCSYVMSPAFGTSQYGKSHSSAKNLVSCLCRIPVHFQSKITVSLPCSFSMILAAINSRWELFWTKSRLSEGTVSMGQRVKLLAHSSYNLLSCSR